METGVTLFLKEKFQRGLCREQEEETLDHFLRQCNGLRPIRARHGVREEDALVEMLLFSNQSATKIKQWRKYLEESWRERVAAVEVEN